MVVSRSVDIDNSGGTPEPGEVQEPSLFIGYFDDKAWIALGTFISNSTCSSSVTRPGSLRGSGGLARSSLLQEQECEVGDHVSVHADAGRDETMADGVVWYFTGSGKTPVFVVFGPEAYMLLEVDVEELRLDPNRWWGGLLSEHNMHLLVEAAKTEAGVQKRMEQESNEFEASSWDQTRALVIGVWIILATVFLCWLHQHHRLLSAVDRKP